jgi:RNA polymerase sigma-70 factor, ECF subfamily
VEDGELAACVQARATPGQEPSMGVALVTDDNNKKPPRDRRATIIALMKAHGDEVLRFCLRMVGDRTLAEDIRQQVFLEAFRDLDGCQQSPCAWLFGIARNRCLDAIRLRERLGILIKLGEPEVEVENPGPDPSELLDRPRLLAALDGCLNRLSADKRRTLLLRFQTDLTFEEMARLLDVTADALQVRVARALRDLRQCLEKKGWTGE